MASRKRSQGRLRKLKASNVPRQMKGVVKNDDNIGYMSNCRHGSQLLPRGNLVHTFVDVFNESWSVEAVGSKMGKIVVDALDNTYKRCREVCW